MSGDEQEHRRRPPAVVIPHRDGNQLIVDEPFELRGPSWACIAKLVKADKPLAWLGDGPRPEPDPEEETTHTLMMVQGNGDTPEAAIRDAIAQIDHICSRPGQTSPPAKITVQRRVSRQPSVPPPRSSMWEGLKQFVKRHL